MGTHSESTTMTEAIMNLLSASSWILLARITAVLLIAWVLHFATRRANPRWQVWNWRIACLALVSLPLLNLALPGWGPVLFSSHHAPAEIRTRERGQKPSAVDSSAGAPQSIPIDPKFIPEEFRLTKNRLVTVDEPGSGAGAGEVVITSSS